MQHKQKRRCGGRVTPSFIRSVRKGYLAMGGTPLPGKECEAGALLTALGAVQDGNYLRGLAIAKKAGIELEVMYRDYRRMIAESTGSEGDFVAAVQRFCNKHNTPIRLRFTA